MEEDIKSDLSSIAFTHPFFSDIVENTLNYIEQLEKENKELLEVKISASAHNQIEKLKQENEELKNLANNKQWIYPCYVAQNYIHRDKIKEQTEWLDNDIKNTKRKIAEEQIYYDDIRKVRLKAYCTKSNEIKNRLKELLGEE